MIARSAPSTAAIDLEACAIAIGEAVRRKARRPALRPNRRSRSTPLTPAAGAFDPEIFNRGSIAAWSASVKVARAGLPDRLDPAWQAAVDLRRRQIRFDSEPAFAIRPGCRPGRKFEWE